MKKNSHIFLLSFLLLCFSLAIAQEDVVEENQVILNPAHQQFAGYSIFDSQPIYNSPWEWLHQTPQGNILRWVKMWDANNWYAAGYGGTFMKTTDGGANWFVNKIVNGLSSAGANEIIYDGFFTDMNTGYVGGGSGGVWGTTDGGLTWDSLQNFSTSATVYDIYFVDDTLGFAAGTSSMRIQRTTDGGVTWTAIWGNLPSATYYTVFAWDVNNIIAGSTSGNVRKTTDGGTTWTTIYVGQSSTLYGLKFTDTMNGWVSGTGDNPAYTTDGGLTWTLSSSVPTTSTQYDVDVLSTVTQILNEDFELATFPPTGWTETGTTTIWDRSTLASGYGNGLASVRANFYGVPSGTGILTSVAFAPTSATDSLKFDHAYATYINEDDQLEIFTSTDGGTTWTSLILLHGGVAGELVTAPPQTSAFVPTAGQWATKTFALPVGTNMVRFDGITAYGNNLFIDNIQVGSPSVSSEVFVTGDAFFIYKTTDMGTTWTPVTFLDPTQTWTSTFYSADFLAPDNFVAVGASGLINEVVSGTPTCYTNWLRPGTLYTIWAQSNTGKVIAGGAASTTTTFNQAMYSTDGGNTWALSAFLDSADVDFNKISMVDTLTGYAACEDYTVYKTTDGGVTWFQVTQPAVSTSDFETGAFVDANTGYVFGASSGAFKTTDGGTSWTPLTTAITTVYASHFVDAMTGFIGGSSGALEKTTDGGTTFTPLTSDMGTSAIYSIYMVNSNLGYLSGSTGKVRKTTDGGTTWTTVDPGTYTPTLYSIDFKDENNGMVVGSSGLTFYTNDGGTTWYHENTSMSTIYAVHVEKFSTDTSAAYVCGLNSHIMKNSHVIVPVELASFSASVNGNNVTLSWMTATELNNRGFLVERTTGEENWTELGFIQGHGTTSETQVYSFIDKDLAAGTYSYRIKQIDFDGSYKYYNLKQDVEIAAPISYALSQNYPNPFNPTTTIKYSVPVDGVVNIAVFNVLGEEVANLVNSVHKAGNYELTFDATNLASGIYIYRMESGNYVAIKKMMILK